MRRLGTVSLALLVTFSSVNHSVFAEDEENNTEETQEITEQTILEETANPEEAIEPEVTETAEPEGASSYETEPAEAQKKLQHPEEEVSPEPVTYTGREHRSGRIGTADRVRSRVQKIQIPLKRSRRETVEETEEVDGSPPFVYEAKDASDMASAVAGLSDDDSRRLVANTEDDLSEILDVEGTAVYYEGSYIISLEDAGNVDDAMVTISSLTDASPVRDERMELCADDLLIQAGHYTEKSKNTASAEYQ